MATKPKSLQSSANKKILPQSNSKSVQPNNTPPMTPELEEQFQLELCWCIHQLQNALKSGKLSNKQVQDHTKALNTLMGNSLIIKKRQVMRLSFGDYRAKMAAEDKKISKTSLNMKVEPGTPCKKSVFIKKSGLALSNGNTFKFNFPPQENEINDSISSIKIGCKSDNEPKDNVKVNRCQFVPSDNSFRFKFNVNESL